jgi:hypothetical protein
MRDRIDCPACARPVEFERFHAGFGDQGFMYGATAPTVLTWSSFDPVYQHLAPHVHPWMLPVETRTVVEGAVRSDLPGSPYRFSNQPLCPHCKSALPMLFDDSRAYFVVVADRIDAEAGSKVWRDE